MRGLGENRPAASSAAAIRRRPGPRTGRPAPSPAVPPVDLHNQFGAVLLGPGVVEVDAAAAAPLSQALAEAALRGRLLDRFASADAAVFRPAFKPLLAAALSAAKTVTGRDTAWFCDVASRLNVARATELVGSAPGGVAALVVDTLEAPPTVLADLRFLADRHGAVLIFDDSRTALRVHAAGGQGVSGVEPDLSLLGAVVANGRPIAAAVGRARLLQAFPAGDGPDAATLSAACATLDRAERLDASAVLRVVGAEIVAELEAALRRTGADGLLRVVGDPTWSRLTPGSEASVDREAMSAFVAAAFKAAGVLCPAGVIPACSTGEAEVSRLVRACDRAFPKVVEAHRSGRFALGAAARRAG